MNALLTPWDTEFGLPPFAAISDADFGPAFDAALAGFGTPAQDIDLPIIHMHGEKLACPLEDLFDWQAVHGKTLPQEVN